MALGGAQEGRGLLTSPIGVVWCAHLAFSWHCSIFFDLDLWSLIIQKNASKTRAIIYGPRPPRACLVPRESGSGSVIKQSTSSY